MTIRHLFLIVLLYATFLSHPLKGQIISESPEVAALIKSYTLSNKQSEFISGWRVQIIATTDRLALENTKTQFQHNYPDIPYLVVHNRPYYHLRVGAFFDKKRSYSDEVFFQENLPRSYGNCRQ